EGREAPDLHVLPGGAVVRAPEDAHAHGEEHRARCRAGHAEGMAVHHALDLRVAHDAALEVGPVGELDQGLAHVLPGLAAIARAHDTVHLEPGIELARVARVGGHAGHAAVEAHLHVAGRLEPELPPGVAAVLALVDGRGRGPGVHDPRVAGIEEEGPDLLGAVGERDGGPRVPTVRAAIRPLVGARVYDLRVARVHRDGMDLGVG